MMKVPYSWLREYVNFTYSPEELAERLTMAGLEVGTIEVFAPFNEKFVVARIEKLSPHPHDRKLRLVTVDCGKDMLSVVCGAWNIKRKDLVVLALPGAVLPAGGEIRAVEIKGILSQGLFCSAKELNLDLVQEDNGILIIKDRCYPGTPFRDVLPINEYVLNLELTPNRPDCLGLLGVAREVSVLAGTNLVLPPFHFKEEKNKAVQKVALIDVWEPELCTRYAARMIEGIKVCPSPLKIQLRLLAAGIRPINNIVDITNYVMWETGQPLHAFDFDKLNGGEIIVRCAFPGERILTLDGINRELDEEVLVIADARLPIGLAGVMGGKNTEITSETRRVLLESACFNSANIRRTAHRLNLTSEASQRFEKGVDPDGIIFVQARAAGLMQKIAGGQILGGIIDSYPRGPKKTIINLRHYKVEELLGCKVGREEIERILGRLGHKIETTTTAASAYKPGQTTYAVEVPSHRRDLSIEVDLVEEIVRIKGYDTIPVTMPAGVLTVGRFSRPKRIISRVKEILTSCGLQEVITFSFMNPYLFDLLEFPKDDSRRRAVRLQNPLTEEQAIMRTTLLPNLIRIMQYNFNRQIKNQFLFELGKVFIPAREKGELPQERLVLGFLLSGAISASDWQQRLQEVDFYFLKGIMEDLFKKLSIKNYLFKPGQFPMLHPTRGASLIIDGKEQGILGALHPQLKEKLELKGDVYLAELNMKDILQAASLSPSFKPLPRFPAVFRDVAFLVPAQISAGEMFAALREYGGELLSEIKLFDVYKGDQVPEGHLSLAFSLTFRHKNRTLKDEEIDKIQEVMEERLYKKYNALLRKQ